MKIFHIDGLAELKEHMGEEIAVSGWLPLDQQRVSSFAEVTEDLQWIHIDPERAMKESPYGCTVAHGYLTLSLLPRLQNECIRLGGVRMGINYGLDRVRFMAPVKVGDSIRARFVLLKADEIPGGMQVVWRATIEVDSGEKPACVADVVSRRYA